MNIIITQIKKTNEEQTCRIDNTTAAIEIVYYKDIYCDVFQWLIIQSSHTQKMKMKSDLPYQAPTSGPTP